MPQLPTRPFPPPHTHPIARRTFIERYGQYAATLAEKVGTFREKEAATRDRFRSHIECFVPGALLEAMGLVAPPPHCQIHVPGDADGAVLAVGVEDVYAFQVCAPVGVRKGEDVRVVSGVLGARGVGTVWCRGAAVCKQCCPCPSSTSMSGANQAGASRSTPPPPSSLDPSHSCPGTRRPCC